VTEQDTNRLLTDLDDPAVHERLDPAGMHDTIAAFPDQLRVGIGLADAIDWRGFKPTTPAGICFCGMGGSAIGGDLARAYWESISPIPMVVIRGYALPAYVNSHWFIIASSYSGNTAETLAAVTEASQRRCKRILAITAGGILANLAKQQDWPLITMPDGFMPRATLGYSFAATMVALAQWGISGNNPLEMAGEISQQLIASAEFLTSITVRFHRDAPASQNPAKSAAVSIARRNVVVMGAAGSTDALALRLKSQLCENGKLHALASVLPEANHNEVVGLDALGESAPRPIVILPCTGDEGEGILAQQRAFVARLCLRNISVLQLNAEGKNRLQRMLHLVSLGDFISYYAAIAGGIDPTPIVALEEIKASLRQSK